MRIVKLGNNNEIPNTIDIKDQTWGGIFCQTITRCRHNAQTLVRKKYKDNERNKQIPDSFPGMVLITETGNVNLDDSGVTRTDRIQKKIIQNNSQ
eukprot:jgi/Psemu1/59985/gm1.59985_g